MLKRLLTAAILALLALPVHAAGLYPLSRMQIMDSNSKVLPGARLFIYDGGTSTPRVAYRDLALTTAHPNPIVADSAGRLPLIYLDDGYYRQRLTSRTGSLIFDDDGIPVLTTSAGGTGTSVDPDSVFKTRDIKIRFDDQPLAGYVRLNGRTIGSASSGATERANADTQSLYEELWNFLNISVSGGKGASAAADFAANKALVLPNAAGRGIFGMDNMGAGIQNVLTQATSGNTQAPGTYGGAETITLSSTYLPVSFPWSGSYSGSSQTSANGAHTHPFSGTTGGTSATHTHGVTVTAPSSRSSSTQAGGGNALTNIWTGTTSEAFTSGTESINHVHDFSGTTDASVEHTHTYSWSGSVTFGSNSGGGQAMNKLSPYMTFMIFIRL